MLDCAELGCSVGIGSGRSRIVKFSTEKAKKVGFACVTCGLTWWVTKINNIPKITDEYFQNTQREIYLLDSIFSDSVEKESYLIIEDEEFLDYYNNLCDLRLIEQVKNQTIFQTGILVSRRIEIFKPEKVLYSAKALDAWIRYPERKILHVGSYILPKNYLNIISRDSWDLIKSINPDIKIIDINGNPIPRPSR
jgi:hypothetical protein